MIMQNVNIIKKFEIWDEIENYDDSVQKLYFQL